MAAMPRTTKMTHIADEGRDAQPSDRDRAVSGCGDRLRRRDPRRGRDRHGCQTQGGAHRLHGFESEYSRRVQPWEVEHGKPERIASALHIMLEGPIGGAAFNNEFGRPNLLGYFRTFEQEVGRRDARLSQADHDRRRPRQHRRTRRAQAAARRGRAARPARRPRHADRPGRRRGLVDGHRRQQRRPRLRFGAARQRRDAAPRAGSHRPLLAAGRRQSDPVHPRCRRGRPVQCAAGARARRRQGRAASICARCRSKSRGMSPSEIWCNEAQERYVLAIRAERAGSVRGALRTRALPVRRARARDSRTALAGRRSGVRQQRRSTCRCRCCSASRRR